MRAIPSRLLRVLFFLVLAGPATVPAQPIYQTGKMMGIEKKGKITPMTYVFEVVASYYEPVTYELQIQVGGDVYFTDYTPDVQPNWALPEEWKPDRDLAIRTDKHRLFVKLSYDGEITTYIARHGAAKKP